MFLGHRLLVVGSCGYSLTFNVVPCKSYSTHCSNMSAKKNATSTSVVGKGKNGGQVGASSVYSNSKKPTKLLFELEFRERFCIPNGISIHLVDGDPTFIEKEAPSAIFFNKELFNAGLRLPLPSLSKQFLHYTKIPLAFIHPNIVRVLMGCSILDMLFHLDLSLLEVFFIYTIKMSKKGIFSMSAHILSLQLVTGLLDLNKGGAKRHVLVRGPWAGLVEHPDRDFYPCFSLIIPGKDDFVRSFTCSLMFN